MVQMMGYVITVIVGITLGLMGSGGSILTVPNLVYLFGINPMQATSYSLFIIGITSLIGSFSNIKDKKINFNLAIRFGLPSILAMVITRSIILPMIPQQIGDISKDVLLMTIFALVMIIAAYSMITNRQKDCIECGKKMEKNHLLLIIQGIIIGFVSGILGAGGGFLIIPGLVIFAKVPMKSAVATSLLIVAVNSMVGFASDFTKLKKIDWTLLSTMTILSIVGIFIGNRLIKHINAEKLKPVFGYFIMVIALIILIQEFL